MKVETVSFDFDKDATTFTLKDNQGEHRIACGLGHWVKGETMLPGEPPQIISNPAKAATKAKVAACGSWKDDDTFVMTWDFFETPHSDLVTCHFERDTLRVEFTSSILGKMPNFKETRPVLEGRRLA